MEKEKQRVPEIIFASFCCLPKTPLWDGVVPRDPMDLGANQNTIM